MTAGFLRGLADTSILVCLERLAADLSTDGIPDQRNGDDQYTYPCGL